MLVIARTASVTARSPRRSIRLVSQAVTGDPTHNTMAPKVISRPAVRMLTSSPSDNSFSMPAGASTAEPVTTLPSIRAVGAKRLTATGRFSMQPHVSRAAQGWKGEPCDYFAALSCAPTVCRCTMFFGGGQVPASVVSALASPSVENFAARDTRLPSAACTDSMNSNCGTEARPCTEARVTRSAQISYPCNFTGGQLKCCSVGATPDIATVGWVAPAVSARRWKFNSNCSLLEQMMRHCANRQEFPPSSRMTAALVTMLRTLLSNFQAVS